MKKYVMFKKSLLALVLAAASGSAFAAPIANLKIDGKVTPPTCTINGEEQGELLVNFGAVSPTWLLATGLTSEDFKLVGTQTVPLTISCDAQTYMTFIPVDTYAGRDVGLVNRSALVAASDTSILVGNSYFEMSNMTVDGKTAFLGRETSAYGAANVAIPVPGARAAWTSEMQTNVASSAFKMVAGKVFAADLQVYARLYSKARLQAANLDLTEQIDYIGENVLAFNFGI
ncbi:DUF1120 domain-containing protein [Serratia fonticola]|uniref:DUF1120 domain-containing protein n=1 Tax=Serratia fonticola TaxID=47917 RepID=UPI0034C6BBA1|nr:DUF1120 domain-containing protein [Serratia fonticola]